MNDSLYKLGKVPSPLCSLCGQEEETSDHILFRCSSVEENLRVRAIAAYELANADREEEDTYIGLLNASKNPEFVQACLDVINTVDLRVTIEL